MSLSKPDYSVDENVVKTIKSFPDKEIRDFLKKSACSINQNMRNGESARIAMLLVLLVIDGPSLVDHGKKLAAWAHPLNGRGGGRDCTSKTFYLADTRSSASPSETVRRCGIVVTDGESWDAGVKWLEKSLPSKYEMIVKHFAKAGWDLVTGMRIEAKVHVPATNKPKTPPTGVNVAKTNDAPEVVDLNVKPAAVEKKREADCIGDAVFDAFVRNNLDISVLMNDAVFLKSQLERLEGRDEVTKKPRTDG